jgi:Lon protease-like protein
MLADCLEGDQRFGITTVGSTRETPVEGEIGCIAHIRACHQLPDGRSNLVVLGERRFVVRELLDEDQPYHVALVEAFDDDPDPPADPDALADLRRKTEAYAAAMAVLNDATSADIEWPEDAPGLSFQVSALLELPLATRQRLLALRSATERVRLLLQLLPDLTHDAATRARIHVGARSNGKGGHHPQIVTEP